MTRFPICSNDRYPRRARALRMTCVAGVVSMTSLGCGSTRPVPGSNGRGPMPPGNQQPGAPDASGTPPDGNDGGPSAPGIVDGAMASDDGGARCTLMWGPDPNSDGVAAFEGVETADYWGSHPGVKHFYPVASDDVYRVDVHYPPDVLDLDNGAKDRQRNEVKGMQTAKAYLQMLEGQRWRIAWSLYVPSSLEATTTFTHIMQIKAIDTSGSSGGAPVITVSLPRRNGMEMIDLELPGLIAFNPVPLAPLHDKWLSAEVDITLGAGTDGSVRWILKDGANTVVDAQKTGIETWPANTVRLRPKWGIYRSINDTSSSLKTAYMLLRDMQSSLCN
jgi:hypothetical protein